MPLGQIVGEVLGGLARVVASLVLELVFEILIKGVGYAIITFVRPKSEPGEAACAVVGLAFWAAVIVVGVLVYRAVVAVRWLGPSRFNHAGLTLAFPGCAALDRAKLAAGRGCMGWHQ